MHFEASIKSWAHIAKGYNQIPAEDTSQNPNLAEVEVNNSGVKLPPGIKSEPSNHGSIKFGSIEPSDYQQTTTRARPTGAATQAASQGPSHGSNLKTAGSSSASNNAKQAPSNSAMSRNGAANRVPRAPQQPVAVAGMPQPSPYATQSMATAYVLSPSAGPVSGYPQAFMLAYNPGPATGPQSYYTGSGFGQGQYGGAYNYGATLPGPAMGGNVSEVPNLQIGTHPQTSTYIPNQSTPSKATQPTPVVQRQKKILRIENPDTHEVLDLAGIRADTDTKKTVSKSDVVAETIQESKVCFWFDLFLATTMSMEGFPQLHTSPIIRQSADKASC